jgi:hypothetical protein|tara:strand:+ start:9103 stop:9300 length:198 start_codon:yes stop_codon:yes gene_type:complete
MTDRSEPLDVLEIPVNIPDTDVLVVAVLLAKLTEPQQQAAVKAGLTHQEKRQLNASLETFLSTEA